ncbi:MAG TPA: RagB/SusD family nutrient uptake outer membrane protein [Draconibacterium sp.]|nr:RagB/SusD family nutrient uptake outer membrane protein [Draconibacterium sp.]
MRKNIKYLILGLFTAVLASCSSDWLDRDPYTIITEEQVWNDPNAIEGLLANYYNRIPAFASITDGWRDMTRFDDAMWSGYTGEEWRNQDRGYATDLGRLWNYDLIRDINLAIENIDEYSVELTDAQKSSFKSELRFLRAFNYFELVKRMGGVPLITSQLIYDYSGDPTPLQVARSTEAEVYEFIASEMDDIKDVLGNEGSYTRVNKYVALALKSRAMLYAASLAKYNSALAVPITTPNGEVGIPASKAAGYYQTSLDASEEIINSGVYSLFQVNNDLGENFYQIFDTKGDNSEVIWAKDFDNTADKRHGFAYDNIARGLREDNLASSVITPSLNLVESYPYLDGTTGPLQNKTEDGSDYIYYDELDGIYADRDARLYGTVLYSGTSFKGLPVGIQAGVKVWNGDGYDTVEGDDIGTNYTDGETLVGPSGPHRSMQEVSNTGFYLRKLIQSGAGTSTRGIRSDNMWIYFRLGEIYLNAAEAAMELGEDGSGYINTLRLRAGYPANSISESDLDLDLIMNERRIELAFEDHRYFDMKRWRKAHILWNGESGNPDAVIYALYPYRVVGGPNDGKYVFEKLVAPRFLTTRYFEMKNYYSFIAQSVMDNNPKIVPNPFQ